MPNQWFYKVMGDEFGPVRTDELRQLAKMGRIGRDSFIRRASGDRWYLAERVKGLFEPPEAKATTAANSSSRQGPPAANPSEQLSCRNCQASLAVDAVVCAHCGFDQRTGIVIAADSSRAARYGRGPATANRKKLWPIVWGASAALILAAVAVVGLWRTGVIGGPAIGRATVKGPKPQIVASLPNVTPLDPDIESKQGPKSQVVASLPNVTPLEPDTERIEGLKWEIIDSLPSPLPGGSDRVLSEEAVQMGMVMVLIEFDGEAYRPAEQAELDRHLQETGEKLDSGWIYHVDSRFFKIHGPNGDTTTAMSLGHGGLFLGYGAIATGVAVETEGTGLELLKAVFAVHRKELEGGRIEFQYKESSRVRLSNANRK